MKTLLGMLAVVVLTGCATTSQLEAVDLKADIALAQSEAALEQSEAALVASAKNSEKIDRMYTKLMAK